MIYLKRPFGGPEYVLQYLGRYTHRVAISDHRLVSFVDGQVTFRWRDSADHNKQKPLPLSVDEFLGRFLLHILPKGFVRIRNFGSWPTASAPRSSRFAFSCGLGTTAARRTASLFHRRLFRFLAPPKCGGPMKVIERLDRCRNPTSFSTTVGRCGMRRTVSTRKLRVLRCAPSLCLVARSIPSSHLFNHDSAALCGPNHIRRATCRASCPAAQSRHIFTVASFPQLNFVGRVHRNHGRPRSNGFTGRAQNSSPAVHLSRERASGKALTLIKT